MAGLFRTVLASDGRINPRRWAAARDSGEVIGQCRHQACEGYLVVDDPHGWGAAVEVEFYTARCTKCDSESASPAGRVLARSGRASERPRNG